MFYQHGEIHFSDAIFDGNFMSLLRTHDLPHQRALLRGNTESYTLNIDALNKITGPPGGIEEEFPDDLNLPDPSMSVSG